MLSPGTRLGPYEIQSAIGAGGMGEVYKARDTRLERTVAIKVLPPSLAADPQFKERFDREAKSISALNHPNICTLYDVGEGTVPASEGGLSPFRLSYLVMEYLDGETLAERLTKGAMPLVDALKIAADISSALDKAHRAGIVHRDLKPGNVMLTKAGAKLLDFGLAKAGSVSPLSGVAPTMLATSPRPTTAGTPLTAQGTILGTFQYMAPEQIEGEDADARTDIFAFGAVLYEMLTGRKAFTGKSQASLLGAILKDQPLPVSQIQPLTPPALDRVVATCLAKDRDDRFQSAHDLVLQLRWIAEGGSAAGLPAPVVAHRKSRERAAWIGLAVASLVLIATAVPAWKYFSTPPDDRQIRFTLDVVDGLSTTLLMHPHVSPDGRLLAYAAAVNSSTRPMLWIRPMDGLDARPLPGTENAQFPFWSADSRFLGFAAAGKLKRIDVSGGPPQILCDVGGFAGGTWSRDDVIVFSGRTEPGGGGGTGGPLQRIPAAGGAPVPLAAPDQAQRESAYMWPAFLPDGRNLLYLVWSSDVTKRAIHVRPLDGGSGVRVLGAESNVAFAAPGYLLFHRLGTLFAQPFDADRNRLSGDPRRVAEGVVFSPVSGRAAFSVSADGILAVRSGAAGQLSDLTWVSRAGKPLGTVGTPDTYDQMRLSPDEKQVAATRVNITAGRLELAVLDLGSNITTQVTLDDANMQVNDPVWSPDSASVMFESTPKGKRDFYEHTLGSRGARVVFESADDPKWLDDWSHDGAFVLFHVPFPGRLYALPLAGPSTSLGAGSSTSLGAGDRKPTLLTQTSAALDGAHFSWDGKWVTFVTNETGQYEVWVASFPKFDQRRRVSANGGGQPWWRADGQELFYLTLDGKVMSVAVRPDPARAGALEFRAPVELFMSLLTSPNPATDQYGVTRDGQRFLFIAPKQGAAAPTTRFTVVVNWLADLRK